MKVAGIDGCKKRWVAVVLDDAGPPSVRVGLSGFCDQGDSGRNRVLSHADALDLDWNGIVVPEEIRGRDSALTLTP